MVLVLDRVGGGVQFGIGVGERVTMVGKGRGKVKSEAGEITGLVAAAPIMDSQG